MFIDCSYRREIVLPHYVYSGVLQVSPFSPTLIFSGIIGTVSVIWPL